MMEWFNKYAPRFMCVGRKPHTFGNERHTICCGLTYILWRAQIVEGKYRPQPLGQKEYNYFVDLSLDKVRLLYWTMDFVSPKVLHSSNPKVYMRQI